MKEDLFTFKSYPACISAYVKKSNKKNAKHNQSVFKYLSESQALIKLLNSYIP